MGAPLKNTNARKWTEERVTECLDRMIDDVNNNEDTVHISFALVNEGLYCEIWTYWKRTFCDNEAVTEKINQIDHILETKLMVGGLSGKLDPVVVKFALANSYQWKKDKKPEYVSPFEIRKRELEDAYVTGDDGRKIMLKDYNLSGFERHIRQPEDSRKRWTDEEVIRYIERMKQAVILPNVYTHHMALLRIGLRKQVWEIWKENYSADITDMMKEVEDLYSVKLMRAAIYRRVNRSLSLYILKKLYHRDAEEKPTMGDPNEIKGTFILTEDTIHLIGCSN